MVAGGPAFLAAPASGFLLGATRDFLRSADAAEVWGGALTFLDFALFITFLSGFLLIDVLVQSATGEI
jgi:hypothetical protein